MREIKFRAWHKLHKELVYFDKKKLCKDSFQQQHLCNSMRGDHGDALMQFTGLQDKNGVDIYEGDIVTGDYSNLSVDYSKQGEVMMGYTHDSNGWSCRKTYGWVTSNGSSLADLEECLIIGNIHENPELLELNHE